MINLLKKYMIIFNCTNINDIINIKIIIIKLYTNKINKINFKYIYN